MVSQRKVWRNHVYGLGYKQENKKLLYVQVPKCASMWMRRYVTDYKNYSFCTDKDFWVGCNFEEINANDYLPIIFLRDPIERFLSYCPVKPTLSKPNFNFSFDAFFEDLKNNLSKDDEHLVPQTNFIKGLDLSEAVFFKVNDKLSQNVKAFFTEKCLVEIPVPVMENISPSDNETKEALKVWRNVLSQEKYFKLFEEIYFNDYELINRVNFYDAR